MYSVTPRNAQKKWAFFIRQHHDRLARLSQHLPGLYHGILAIQSGGSKFGTKVGTTPFDKIHSKVLSGLVSCVELSEKARQDTRKEREIYRTIPRTRSSPAPAAPTLAPAPALQQAQRGREGGSRRARFGNGANAYKELRRLGWSRRRRSRRRRSRRRRSRRRRSKRRRRRRPRSGHGTTSLNFSFPSSCMVELSPGAQHN